MDRLRRWKNLRRAGNVAGIASEVDMTRIAYAVPREIHLAVVGPPERCNIFPTDLHGAESSGHYLLSLRHGGKACAQVQEAGSLALFRMPLACFREVYALGGRHAHGPRAAAEITAIDGAWNAWARPVGALSARSLRVLSHDDVGIHRIFRCTIEGEERFGEAPVLSHAHASPLTFLEHHGRLPAVFLR
jgi:hypothetical protein